MQEGNLYGCSSNRKYVRFSWNYLHLKVPNSIITIK